MGCCKVKEEKKTTPFGEGNLHAYNTVHPDNQTLISNIENPTSKGEPLRMQQKGTIKVGPTLQGKVGVGGGIDTQQALVNGNPNSERADLASANTDRGKPPLKQRGNGEQNDNFKSMKSDEKTLQNQGLIMNKQSNSTTAQVSYMNEVDNTNQTKIKKDMEETQNISTMNNVQDNLLKKENSIIFHHQSPQQQDADFKLPEIAGNQVYQNTHENAFSSISHKELNKSSEGVQIESVRSKEEIKKERERIKNAISQRSQEPTGADRQIAFDYVNSLFKSVAPSQSVVVKSKEVIKVEQKEEAKPVEEDSPQILVSQAKDNMKKEVEEFQIIRKQSNKNDTQEVVLPPSQKSQEKEVKTNVSKIAQEQSETKSNHAPPVNYDEKIARDYVQDLFSICKSNALASQRSQQQQQKQEEQGNAKREEQGNSKKEQPKDLVSIYLQDLKKRVIDQVKATPHVNSQ